MDTSGRGARGYRAAVALFAVAWLALNWPWLSGVVTIPYDAKAHFYAQILFLAQTLHSGQSPFWLPNVFGGSPHIGDPQSLIFSPALILAFFHKAPSFQAFDAFVLGHLLLGGFAMMMFARERGWHPAAALVAGLVFAFGASAAWRVQHVGQVLSLSFFALAFWLTARAMKRGSLLSGALAGLAGAMMVVEPNQVGYLGALALVGFIIGETLLEGVAGLRRHWRALTCAAVTGLAATALPLLWTALFARMTTRSVIDYAEAAKGSLHPASLLTFFVSDLFGAKSPTVEFWGPSSPGWSSDSLFLAQNMGQVYIGALPVLLVVIALLRGWLWDRQVRIVALLALAMLLYALGRYTPAFAAAYALLPGVDAFRRPSDATFLIGALMAPLAAFAVHRVLAERSLSDRWMLVAAATVVLAMSALAVAVGLARGRVDEAFSAIGPALVWLALAVAAVATFRWLARRGPLRGGSVAACLIAVLALAPDLARNNGPNESTALPPALYDVMRPDTRNETIRVLKRLTAHPPGSPERDRVELLGIGFDWPNLGMIHGFDHTLGYNPLRLQDVSDAVGTRDTIVAPSERKFTKLFDSYNCRLANLMGLRYVVSRVPIGTIDKKLAPGDLRFVAKTPDGFIYENPRALPRVLFTPNWQVADFEQITETGKWPAFNPRETVLLEEEPELERPTTEFNRPAQVGIARYENTVVEITVDAPTSGFVVLNDVWHPWWSAEVNNVAEPIYKANVLFRAVAVPAGKSVVRFTFTPLEGAIAELREEIAPQEEPRDIADTPEASPPAAVIIPPEA